MTAGLPRAGSRARRRLGWALLGLGALAVVLLGWGAAAGALAAARAQAAQTRVEEVRSAVEQEDLPAAREALQAAAAELDGAQRAASALPLVLASHAPGSAGRVVASLRTTVSSADQAVGEGALPLLGVVIDTDDGRALLREDGSVDVAALADVADRVRPAAAALAQARRRMAGVDAAGLPGPLAGPVSSASGAVTDLATTAQAAESALTVLPAALGAEGPRSYLVAFQNTAELRPTGGIIGAWALVGVEDGRTSLQQTGSNDDLEDLEGPVRDLGPEHAALYPPEQVAHSQNVNLSPHFPSAGLLLSDLWEAQGRPAPDGVVAVDPSGLAPLLAGEGEVVVPGGPSISAETVVDVLLRQAYEDFAADNDARQEYLSAVVGTAFAEALGGGAFDAAGLSGLLEAADDGHLVAWSAREDEQAALVRAGLSGALPEPAPDTAGVYLTNVSASKLDYYLTEAVRTAGGCAGSPVTMQVVLHNDAPARVPEYVASKVDGLPATTESLLVALYVPPQRGISQVRVGGQPVAFSAGTERGWSLARFEVQVPRDAETVVDVDLSGAASPLERVLTQPLVDDAEVSTASCGS
ncbi:DUF4012 domain-containing protein [Quadrisphaera sp. DSM 44207]|uniref:DUF4012 domain-containing protein n=1 Tax=Quadrisphaera sp. DSM 44207 TaxID=1881057 RepID=UPI000881FF56|nr:DUF4012 domain-containing protein [Quadrisphaera sp. DSM 44207]SDQ68458.1 Protein of unknown function [Quadrisphaera sp. DSM 44207]